ncbi:cell division protein ZipA [Testudinibacter sp. TR-2022]|uniref:cell division protein ZipA n=1 Tax=Testudinibacter sp. TR-2022 TaxID=2585029 RepID=UPI00111A863F|nr:cell division protein ZipA [Testudinibacter sp. TR-2022]TNH00776.1 cell division protein ZipA [Pasteurellaceae bacterium Phil31]TNH09602.1 cell division protein ZipA [Testudinibacter sp. TR-2022]TNH13074.1 cell division protein ZipA [Testudinibacter sp. TR-2022]TNH13202.1 cell division protein ZipA [Testudinibacter sp. TR-2022]TNH18444.1 cell division protein ZipA [Testudinibacter sp. TR-2022]
MMDLHIILIILIVLILAILVVHGLWSSRREKSQLFKAANTFTYDSRTADSLNSLKDEPDLLHQPTSTDGRGQTTESQASDRAWRTDETALSQTEAPTNSPQHSAQPAVSVEQAVSNIRITLPEQTNTTNQTTQSTLTQSAVDHHASSVDSLSRSSLLNRTIADLEQELDSEEGINTSSEVLREELARVTQQRKINISQEVSGDPRNAISHQTAAPSAAAAIIRAQLNPETENQSSQTSQPSTDSTPSSAEKTDSAHSNEKPKMILLYVVAAQNQAFQGTQVVQSLDNLGFLYGQHSLYHRHLDLDGSSPILFSAANMMKPGIFDLDSIADLRTAGLVLFMHLPSHGSDLANFRLLLRAAQTLADELHGQVLDDKRQPFDQASKEYYLSLIS